MGILKRLYKTGIDIAAQLSRYAKQTQLLKERLDAMVEVPQYQRGYEHWADGRAKTFCNLAAWYLLDSHIPETHYGPFTEQYNVNIEPMLRDGTYKNVLMTPLDIAVVNIIKREIKCVGPQTAQELANKGVPVMGICGSQGKEHVVIVRPNSDGYQTMRGPLISQCGWECGTWYVNDARCWGPTWYALRILWVVFDEHK
jgi:hypothetical protein